MTMNHKSSGVPWGADPNNTWCERQETHEPPACENPECRKPCTNEINWVADRPFCSRACVMEVMGQGMANRQDAKDITDERWRVKAYPNTDENWKQIERRCRVGGATIFVIEPEESGDKFVCIVGANGCRSEALASWIKATQNVQIDMGAVPLSRLVEVWDEVASPEAAALLYWEMEDK